MIISKAILCSCCKLRKVCCGVPSGEEVVKYKRNGIPNEIRFKLHENYKSMLGFYANEFYNDKMLEFARLKDKLRLGAYVLPNGVFLDFTVRDFRENICEKNREDDVI